MSKLKLHGAPPEVARAGSPELMITESLLLQLVDSCTSLLQTPSTLFCQEKETIVGDQSELSEACQAPAVTSDAISESSGTSSSESGAASKCSTKVAAPIKSGTLTGKCPFLHGTVHAAPFPGYVHGRNSAICSNGCTPSLKVEHCETPKQTLLREALEFQNLFHHEQGNDESVKKNRWEEIVAEVENSGTYTHTRDELEHGIRVAWRNAPKCSNRKFWNQVKLLDKRHVTTNQGMFEACLEHIQLAMKNGVTESYLTCFQAVPPGSSRGPRIWNGQLYGYAAYRNENMEVVGDPANALFTDMIQRRFAWKSPSGGTGEWDHLPLVLQIDPSQPPELFEIPDTYWQDVHIWHPQFPFLSKLGLRWYPIPAVSAMEMTVGGILYTGIPFNGWYADTEIVRDLTDEGRYNILPKVAHLMGCDTSQDASLWKDEIQVVINKAVLHSFAHSNVGMVDHHTLISGFYEWYRQELQERGYCPGNWKWIIPPQASALNKAYLKLNKMKEYCLKPAYLYAPSWRTLEQEWFQISAVAHRARVQHKLGVLAWSARMIGKIRKFTHRKRTLILVVYASVTGKTRVFAGRLAALLQGSSCKVELMDAAIFNHASSDKFVSVLERAQALVVMTSTYGNGQVPFSAVPLLEYLQSFDKKRRFGFGGSSTGHVAALSTEAKALLGKPFAVLGFGSSMYPKFCGGAETMHEALSRAGAVALLPEVGKCDSQVGENGAFNAWLLQLVHRMGQLEAMQTVDTEFIRHRTEAGSSLLPVRVRVLSDEEAQQVAMKQLLSGDAEPQQMGGANGRELTAGVETARTVGRVLAATPLLPGAATRGGGERMTTLLRIDLSQGAAPPFLPGDHLRIVPRNIIAPALLQRFCAAIGVEPERVVIPSLDEEEQRRATPEKFPLLAALLGKATTCRDILTLHAGVLSNLDSHACKTLAELLTEEDEEHEVVERQSGGEEAGTSCRRAASDSVLLPRKPAPVTRSGSSVLTALASCKRTHQSFVWTEGLRWIDVFERFPDLRGRLTLEKLLCLMPLTHPRFYSIASSSLCNPLCVDICVGRLVYTLPSGELRQGVASDFLSQAEPGTAIDLNIHTVRSFHLPMDPTAPLLLIGAGTGIAPFRGFWQHRRELQRRGMRLGACLMVWGCRSKEEVLFRSEVEEAVEAGALSEVLVALSREEGVEREYVQDVVREESERVAELLALENAHVYVCGEARMAWEVEKALAEAGGSGLLRRMKKEERFHEDVFGVSIASAQGGNERGSGGA